MLKKMLVSILLIGFLFGLPMPVSVGAQGGDAVYKSLGVIGALRVGGTARFEGPVYGVGPQDVASDLLTSSMNVMSSTYTTVMSASVTTSEPGDSVLVHVTGQFRQMFSLYISNDGGGASVFHDDRLWRLDDLSDPSTATLVGSFPSGLSKPSRIASHGGVIYIFNQSSPRELWRLADLSDPSTATLVGAFPSSSPSFGVGRGMAVVGGLLYIVDQTGDRLWRLDDLSDPSTATLVGSFPDGLDNPGPLAQVAGVLYIMDHTNPRSLWRLDNLASPSGATKVSGVSSWVGQYASGMVSSGGELYLLSDELSAGRYLWRIYNPSTPFSAIRVGLFPVNVVSGGITFVDPMGDCMVRLARGTTEIAGVSFPDRILFDNTFVDSPPVGTHTYAVQVRTVQPDGCTAYLGDGLVPMPSLFVQSYYGGTTP